MTKTSIKALRDEKYLGCPGTTLDDSMLADIGRIFANYGLLVFRIREFVTYAASHSNRYPLSIGSKDAIRLFPSVLEVLKPAFPGEERHTLNRALENFAAAKQYLDQSLYCTWGVISRNEDGTQKVARTEYRRYKNFGTSLDRTEFSRTTLYSVALEIQRTISYVGDVFAMLEQKITDEPDFVRKILN
jgi:hypothetical protein